MFSVKVLEVECLHFAYRKTLFIKIYGCGFCHSNYSLFPKFLLVFSGPSGPQGPVGDPGNFNFIFR